MCAHWSVKFSCFYPGTIQVDDKEDEEEDEDENDKKDKNNKKKEKKEKKPRGRKPKFKTNEPQKTSSFDGNDDTKRATKRELDTPTEGTVGKRSKNGKKELKDLYVNIDFDDEDSGKFPVDFIRLLPRDFPVQRGERSFVVEPVYCLQAVFFVFLLNFSKVIFCKFKLFMQSRIKKI